VTARRRNLIVAVAALALVIAGVLAVVLRRDSGPTSATSPHPNNSDALAASSAPERPTPTSTVSTQAPRPAPRTTERCHTSQLQGGFNNFPEGAAGNDRFDVILTNTSDRTCSVYGYPGLAFLSSGRQSYDVPVERRGSMLAKDPGPAETILPPGMSASASVGYTPNCGAAEPGARPAFVEITPPDEQDFVVASVEMPTGLTLLICGSHVDVTALVSGPNGATTS